jgi:hypothetical protein
MIIIDESPIIINSLIHLGLTKYLSLGKAQVPHLDC